MNLKNRISKSAFTLTLSLGALGLGLAGCATSSGQAQGGEAPMHNMKGSDKSCGSGSCGGDKSVKGEEKKCGSGDKQAKGADKSCGEGSCG